MRMMRDSAWQYVGSMIGLIALLYAVVYAKYVPFVIIVIEAQ